MKMLESTKNINNLKNSHSNVDKQSRPNDIVIEKDYKVNVVKSPSLSSILSGFKICIYFNIFAINWGYYST